MSSHSTIAVTLLLLGTWAAASNAACCNSNQIAYFCQNTAIGDGAVVVASSSGCSCDASSCLNSFYANGNVRPGYSAMSNPDTDIRNAMDTAQAVCDATLVRWVDPGPLLRPPCPPRSSAHPPSTALSCVSFRSPLPKLVRQNRSTVPAHNLLIPQIRI